MLINTIMMNIINHYMLVYLYTKIYNYIKLHLYSTTCLNNSSHLSIDKLSIIYCLGE